MTGTTTTEEPRQWQLPTAMSVLLDPAVAEQVLLSGLFSLSTISSLPLGSNVTSVPLRLTSGPLTTAPT